VLCVGSAHTVHVFLKFKNKFLCPSSAIDPDDVDRMVSNDVLEAEHAASEAKLATLPAASAAREAAADRRDYIALRMQCLVAEVQSGALSIEACVWDNPMIFFFFFFFSRNSRGSSLMMIPSSLQVYGSGAGLDRERGRRCSAAANDGPQGGLARAPADQDHAR
jgi:hypothetical protein